MKRFLLFYLLAASSCIAQSQDIGQIIAATRLDSLVKTVRILSGEDSTYVNGVKVLIKSRSNYLSGGGNDKAADYIKERFLRYNLEVEDQTFNTTGRNILASQPGLNNPDSIFIICAHYDAVANYCADDNASGVSCVIEAARILSGFCFDKTILYASWDNEEDGQLGSKYYAQIASSQGYKIAGVLNIEMTGYDSNNDRKFEIHTNSMATSLTLKNKLIETVNKYSLSLIPTVVNPGTTSSDHASFWNKNFGAVVFSEYYFGGDPNPYYHTDNDRIDKFNLAYFNELGKLSIGTLATLAELIPSCQAENKTLSVSPVNLNIESNAGNTSFDITSNTSWTIADNADWLTINPASGSDNGTITVTYTANSSTTARIGTITISGTGVSSQQVTVTQSGIISLSVTPYNHDVSAEAGSTTFTISSNTSWTIADDADWLTVSAASGSGNGTITANSTANTSTTKRVGTITISGTGVNSQQVTVTQSGIVSLSVTPSNRDVGTEAGSATFTISSNTSWTIADDADWLTVSPASGSGNGTITAIYTANALTPAKIGTITISGTGVSSQQVTVTQSGIVSLSVTPSNRNVGAEAASTTFAISSNTSWTIADDADWLTESAASGNGNIIITATCTANSSTTARVAIITISGTGVSSQQVTVTQNCINTLSVTPSNRDVGSDEESTTFTISSNTSWTIADDADWLTVSAGSGSGNGTITANCTANTSSTTRIGTITISGTGVSSQQVTVTQIGINTLSVIPSNRNVGEEEGSTTFTISSNTSWTIADDADWLTVSAASGSGNGTITANCTANTSTATRVGTITISGTGVSSQQVTVTQSGIIFLSVTPSSRDIGAEAGSTTFAISSNTSWTIADDADWLTESAASGNGNIIITATCTANSSTTARVAIITISGTGVSSQQVTVTQSGIVSLSVTPSNRDVGEEAASTTFTISSNTRWTIADDADWLTVSAASGSGNGTITVTFTANTSTTKRVGTITISGTGGSSQQVTVTQSEINTLSVTPSNRDVVAEAGSTTFAISSNTSWTIADDADWLTINPASGSGDMTITMNYTTNTSPAARIGTITISDSGGNSQKVTVTQSGIIMLSVTPSNRNVGAETGSTSFTISSNTSWTIADDADWLTINPASGSGDMTITMNYTTNTSPAARIGTISFSGTGVSSQQVTVTQNGITSLSVTPANRDVGAEAGSTTFTISSNTSWTITDDTNWITVNSGSGSDNRLITATYTANTLTTPRIGTITISGTGASTQQVTVIQNGVISLSVTPSNRDVGAETGNTTFAISSNTSWTIADDAGWLTLSAASGNGDGTITTTYTTNTSTTARIGTITISGTGVSSQQVTVTQSGINTLSIAPYNRDIGSEAGSTTFTISSNTSWSIANNADWLTLSAASGAGNGTITATYTANTSTTARIGTITVSGTGINSQKVTVIQIGINIMSVIPSNLNVYEEAGSTTFSISSNTSWTITDDADWLTLGAANGSGNRKITATFTANTSTSTRIGTITISGTGVSSRQVTVTQSGVISLSVAPANRDVGSDAGSTTFNIISNTSWSIADDADWLTISASIGAGNGTITATCTANTLPIARVGTITISGTGASTQQVTVIQNGVISLSVTPSNRNVGAEAGSTTFSISSNTSWTITDDSEWLTVNAASGSGNGVITGTYSTNTFTNARIGTITISGTGVSSQKVTVLQISSNTLSVIPSTRDVGAEAGSTTFTISSNISWSITDNADWLTLSAASGAGNGTITATFAANTSTAARIGTITISGTGLSSQQVTVIQIGISTLSVIPSTRDVGSGAGSTTFSISSNTSWSISDDADWLTVSAASGNGDRTITVTYTANSSTTARVGTIIISGTGLSSVHITVTQIGITSFSVTPSNRDVGTKTGSTTFTINSNTSWLIADDADWLTISAVSNGDGNGTITAKYLTNTSSKVRVGIITVYRTGVSSQQVTVTQRANLDWDLRQNYPNPFNNVTTFDFFVPEPSLVEINIFNINGIILYVLLNENLDYGWYSMEWIPPKSLKSGIYFYQLRTDKPKATKKMFYIKQ